MYYVRASCQKHSYHHTAEVGKDTGKDGGGQPNSAVRAACACPFNKSSQIADRRFAVLFRCPSGLAARRFARLPAARHAGRAQRAAPCADSRQGAPLRCCESAHTKGKATCIWPPFQEANEESLECFDSEEDFITCQTVNCRLVCHAERPSRESTEAVPY